MQICKMWKYVKYENVQEVLNRQSMKNVQELQNMQN